MNPIFNRRYKAGSRPNIMPTNKRHSYLKSHSSAVSNSSTSSSGSSGLSTFSLGESAEDPSYSEETLKSPCSEHVNPVPPRNKGNRREGMSSPGDEASSHSASRLLAQQLLANKQNSLAQASLTPHENRQRAKVSFQGKEDERLCGMRHSFSTDNIGQSAASNNMPRSPTVHDIGGDMTLCDLEYDDQTDFAQACSTTTAAAAAAAQTLPSESVTYSRVSRPNLNQRISKESLDMKTWRELRRIVSGSGSFHEGWVGQGFTFDTNVPFGLVQKKGGPCGVLAVVQSLLIRNLLFGSPFIPKDPKDPSGFQQDEYEEFNSFLVNGLADDTFLEKLRKERIQCLVDAVAEIIWICAEQRYKDQNIFLSDEDCCTMIMLSDYRIQPEMIRVQGKIELQRFLQNSIHRFDCISLVYSAVLTRGIEGVKNDMDFENCSLVGQHGYCSQELINLFCLGKAISNTFDNEIELDGKTLKGISSQCNIGLLSLFEHYNSIQVGSFLKCPRYPVWIVCSESHFSVLFSSELHLCKLKEYGGGGDTEISSFDLFYYDGLSRQDKIIRLSIRLSNNRDDYSRLSSDWEQYKKDQFNPSSSRSSRGFGDVELIPPLEKCIRTKWQGAEIDWNDTEPIL